MRRPRPATLTVVFLSRTLAWGLALGFGLVATFCVVGPFEAVTPEGSLRNTPGTHAFNNCECTAAAAHLLPQ